MFRHSDGNYELLQKFMSDYQNYLLIVNVIHEHSPCGDLNGYSPGKKSQGRFFRGKLFLKNWQGFWEKKHVPFFLRPSQIITGRPNKAKDIQYTHTI